MDKRVQERIEFFNAHAKEWMQRNYPEEILQRTKALITSLPIEKGWTVLDVGSGRGVILPFLRMLTGDAGRLVALDPCPGMLEGVPGQDAAAWPLLAQAEKIPLLDCWVDAVVCFSAFPHMEDKARVAKEFFRVLRPGGLAFVLHVNNRNELNRHHDMHHAVMGDHLPDPGSMRKMFLEAGFRETEAHEDEHSYYFSAVK